jgi:hypothetical protein
VLTSGNREGCREASGGRGAQRLTKLTAKTGGKNALKTGFDIRKKLLIIGAAEDRQ